MNIMYILILVIETNGYPVNISQAEFLSKKSCNDAKIELEEKYSGTQPFKLVGECKKK